MTTARRAAEASTSVCVAYLAAKDTATEHLIQSAVRSHGRLRALVDVWYVKAFAICSCITAYLLPEQEVLRGLAAYKMCK